MWIPSCVHVTCQVLATKPQSSIRKSNCNKFHSLTAVLLDFPSSLVHVLDHMSTLLSYPTVNTGRATGYSLCPSAGSRPRLHSFHSFSSKTLLTFVVLLPYDSPQLFSAGTSVEQLD